MIPPTPACNVSRSAQVVVWVGLIVATMIVGVLSPFVSTALAQEIGDRVCVTGNFKTRIYRKEVDRVVEGSIYTVILKM